MIIFSQFYWKFGKDKCKKRLPTHQEQYFRVLRDLNRVNTGEAPILWTERLPTSGWIIQHLFGHEDQTENRDLLTLPIQIVQEVLILCKPQSLISKHLIQVFFWISPKNLICPFLVLSMFGHCLVTHPITWRMGVLEHSPSSQTCKFTPAAHHQEEQPWWQWLNQTNQTSSMVTAQGSKMSVTPATPTGEMHFFRYFTRRKVQPERAGWFYPKSMTLVSHPV